MERNGETASTGGRIRIGYPCLNYSLDCRGNRKFQLASYGETRLLETAGANLKCLERMLAYNVTHDLRFFRISSDLIPFASHPVCQVDWPNHFAKDFARIGEFVREHDLRISMHPDQFTLLNALDEEIVKRSVRELEYHAEVLERMELDRTAKIQIHVGGLYGDREKALDRFAARYERLSPRLRERLVIENDDRLFPLADCMDLHFRTGVPVVFDGFHHRLLNCGEPLREALELAATSWQTEDGPLMVDYSSQAPGERTGQHAESLDPEDFARFLNEADGLTMDVMLEIRDKERSALKAKAMLTRQVRTPDIEPA